MLLSSLLPNYEKNCVAEYINLDASVLVFQADNIKNNAEEITQLVKHNNFELFYDFIQLEYKEVKAFIEAICINEMYNAKKEKLSQKIKDT